MSPATTMRLHNTAARLASGDGVRKNLAKARKLYLEAAKSGGIHACYELGMSYLLDQPKREDDGFLWMRRAARNGVIDAQEFLGDVYARGLFGRQRRPSVALHWYRKAAKNQSVKARLAIRDLVNRSKA